MAPERVHVPVPDLVRPPVPLMMPLMLPVPVPAPVRVSAKPLVLTVLAMGTYRFRTLYA